MDASHRALLFEAVERNRSLPAGVAGDVAAAGEGAANQRLVSTGRQAGNGVQPPLARAQLRHALHQLGGVGVLRLFDDLLRRSQFHQLTGVHDRHPVAELGDDAEIMRDEDDRETPLPAQIVDQRQDLRLHGHVQRCGRLVGDDHVGVVAQRHGDADALAHAAGKLVWVTAEDPLRVGDPHLRQQRQGMLPRFLRGDPLVRLDGFEHLRAHGQQRVQGRERVLKDIGDPVTADLAQAMVRQAHKILAAEVDRSALDHARGRGDQPQDRQRRDGLTRAAFADDAQALAFVQVQVDLPDRAQLPRTEVEGGGQVGQFQHGVGLLRHTGVEVRDLGGGLRTAEGAGLEPGVERVADPITEQVHPHDDDQDHGPGHEGRVRAGDQGRASLPEHRPEIGLRRLGAKAEEGQTGGLEDHPAHGGGDRDHDGGDDVGQDFTDDDAQVVAPVQPRCVDVFEVDDGDGDAADIPGEKRDVDGGDGDQALNSPGPAPRRWPARAGCRESPSGYPRCA